MRNIELLVVDTVHEHIDARQVEGGQVNFLPKETFCEVVWPQNFRELEKQ